jgi:hypothetical protein
MDDIAFASRSPLMHDSAAYPVLGCWLAPDQGWLARIAAHMRARDAHPARTVVLLPYAQLMPLAARLWAQVHPDGFAPRFETTQNWSRSLGGFTPVATDITFDAALDVLTARAMLERTSLGAQADAATPLLLEAAQQLGALAAAVPPSERAAWGLRPQARRQRHELGVRQQHHGACRMRTACAHVGGDAGQPALVGRQPAAQHRVSGRIEHQGRTRGKSYVIHSTALQLGYLVSVTMPQL